MKAKVLILFFLIISSLKITAQEIGVAPVKFWTNSKEIQNPIGVSFYYLQPIYKLGIKLEYLIARNSRSYYGYVSQGFLHRPEDFIKDSINNKSNYSSLEISIVSPSLLSYENNNLKIGLGVTFDKFIINKDALTLKRKIKITDKKMGFFYGVSFSYFNIFDLPVKIELLFKQKALINNNYSTDTSNPFQDVNDIKELQLNIGYLF